MKDWKERLASLAALCVIGGVMLAVTASVVLVDAGLFWLLGVRYDSLWWLILFVLLKSVIGLPLELFTNGVAGALVELGWASPRAANVLYIPLDALCSAFAFWVSDALLKQVETDLFAIVVVGLVSALFSQPVKKAVERGGDGRAGPKDGDTA